MICEPFIGGFVVPPAAERKYISPWSLELPNYPTRRVPTGKIHHLYCPSETFGNEDILYMHLLLFSVSFPVGPFRYSLDYDWSGFNKWTSLCNQVLLPPTSSPRLNSNSESTATLNILDLMPETSISLVLFVWILFPVWHGSFLFKFKRSSKVYGHSQSCLLSNCSQCSQFFRTSLEIRTYLVGRVRCSILCLVEWKNEVPECRLNFPTTFTVAGALAALPFLPFLPRGPFGEHVIACGTSPPFLYIIITPSNRTREIGILHVASQRL